MLAEARGFVFDLDGTLVSRTPDGPRPFPGAAEVIAAARAGGRGVVVFTNASHAAPATIAGALRASGLEIRDDEVLTPICSAIGELTRRYPGRRVHAFATPASRARLREQGVALLEPAAAAEAEIVLVAHADECELEVLEAAAHAVRGGARLLTANYAPTYAGADGPILSRGAMLTAAVARAAQRRPTVVGKPSRAAVREYATRLGVDPAQAVVVGDDLAMDIGLGRLGGSTTVLVRTGISDDEEVARAPWDHRPAFVLDRVADLLELA